MVKCFFTVVLLNIAIPCFADNEANLSLAKSNLGMAVTAHPAATQAAIKTLEQGGNAVDAAVAAAFSIPVVEPTMSSIGGRIQILLRLPTGEFVAYDGMTEIPTSYNTAALESVSNDKNISVGYEKIATPGVVAALGALHKEHGQQAWGSLLEPAISLATEGVYLLPGEVARQQRSKKQIAENSGFREIFFKNADELYSTTDLFKQLQLGKTLEVLASEGAEGFYRGSVAKKIAEDMSINNGFVGKKDLENYQTKPGRIVSIQYRDRTIHTIAAPAGGGLLVKTLNILENFQPENHNHLEWVVVINQAIALALDSMNSDYYENDLDLVVSKNWAKEQAQSIQPIKINLPEKKSTSEVAQYMSANDMRYSAADSSSHHTTHFVTADCKGNVVSITQTLGPVFGAKVISPELGFVYASTMGGYLSTNEQKPGVRLRTTIAPTVISKQGKTELVLGAAGGLRILSSLVQTISKFVDDKQDLSTAIYSPRIHPISRTDPETKKRKSEGLAFLAETTLLNGWDEAEISAWRDAGIDVKTEDRYGQFGRVQAVQNHESAWLGVTDPDWEGLAQGLVMTDLNQKFCTTTN